MKVNLGVFISIYLVRVVFRKTFLIDNLLITVETMKLDNINKIIFIFIFTQFLPNHNLLDFILGTGTAVVIKSTPQQQLHNSPPVSAMTLTGQVSSNQSSTTSNVITVSKQIAQGVGSSNNPQTILPGNLQILNVNALRPQNSQGGINNKNMPRVMIPQVVGARPGAPGVSYNLSIIK